MQKQPIYLCANCQTSKPKGVMSAYMFFHQATLPKLLEESKLSLTESAKRIGVMWSELEDKSKFVEMHQADVLR